MQARNDVALTSFHILLQNKARNKNNEKNKSIIWYNIFKPNKKFSWFRFCSDRFSRIEF